MDIEKLSPWNWFTHEDNKNQWFKEAKEQSKHSAEYLKKELDRLREVILATGNYLPFRSSAGFSKIPLRPKTDIIENKDSYKIIIEIPGVKEDEMLLEANDNVLKISGEKKQEIKEDGEEFHFLERSYGKFQRIISLPEDVDAKEIEAEHRDGLVIATLPRKKSSVSGKKQIKFKKSAS